MQRKTKVTLLVIAALVLVALVALPRISFFMLTGHFVPIKKVETLQNPIEVKGWSADGLKLTDGRTVQLPEFRAIPSQSEALAEVTKRGVEIGADGRVYGLVKIHHWCGNDPVREHIVKVDISEMMIFLHVGEPITPITETEFTISEPGGSFNEWGWRIEEFMVFQSWQSFKHSTHDKQP